MRTVRFCAQCFPLEKMSRNFLLVLLVGLAFMLIFTAFNTAAQANESIMEGARQETNGTFSASGYISLGLVYFSCAVFNWISPVVILRINSKYGMFFGALSYLVFLTSFFRPNTYVVYLTSCLLGMGAAILWTSHGVYMTLCSKPSEMSRNFGIFWMLFQSSTIIGSIYTYLHLSDVISITSTVRLPMYAAFTTICVVGCLILLLLPPLMSDVNSPASSEPLADSGVMGNAYKDSSWEAQNVSDSRQTPEPLLTPDWSITNIMLKSISLFQTKTMILILLATAFTGINLTFFSGVFGTCLSRMQRFGSSAKSYIGLSGIFIGIGELLGSQLSLLGNIFGSGGIICFGFASALVAQFMAFLMIPASAPIQITDELSYITPSVTVAMFTALLLGLTDSIWNVQISALIGKIYPTTSGTTAAAFALFKFVQSVTSAVAFFYSSVLLLHWQVLLLASSATVAVFAFLAAEKMQPSYKPVFPISAINS